jgi:hypothetical protein
MITARANSHNSHQIYWPHPFYKSHLHRPGNQNPPKPTAKGFSKTGGSWCAPVGFGGFWWASAQKSGKKPSFPAASDDVSQPNPTGAPRQPQWRWKCVQLHRCKNGATLVQQKTKTDQTRPTKAFLNQVGSGRVRSPLVAFGYQVPKKPAKFPSRSDRDISCSILRAPQNPDAVIGTVQLGHATLVQHLSPRLQKPTATPFLYPVGFCRLLYAFCMPFVCLLSGFVGFCRPTNGSHQITCRLL